MLQIKSISKKYKTGELVQKALDGISLNLRNNEFVAVLGPSGSGKTTLLNIIGGLDRYDSGDLIINGVSTKKYRDRDWDSYRNHTIGFVFQSYNLIPHQSILSNVELALTISGISRRERRKRARQALEEVGLGDQIHKRPNQMSGGQMQRVAIARALVNNPDILLADEPTGALDSETSVTIMDLLKKVADKRLVVMVTHNPELAENYSTRIVRLRDGKITDDSNPYEPEEVDQAQSAVKRKKAKMSFLTSLSLSFNNLRTKKGRTILTSFAGSIGIIGIALILALSTGVNQYITDIQKETMTSYPITISAETLDMSEIFGMQSEMIGEEVNVEKTNRKGVYADSESMRSSGALSRTLTENDLTSFKEYLDDPKSEINKYVGENGIVYNYKVNFNVYSYDKDGKLVNSDADIDELTKTNGKFTRSSMGTVGMSSFMETTGSSENAKNFAELLRGSDGNTVSKIVTDNYKLVYGSYPEKYDEVVLVLDKNNSVDTGVLYQLGIITGKEYKKIDKKIRDGEKPEEKKFSYKKICGHKLYLVAACDRFKDNGDGTFSYIGDSAMEGDSLMKKSLRLKITGIIKSKGDSSNIELTAPVAYTSKLTDYIIKHTNKSAVIRAQEKTPKINVLNGMRFEAKNKSQKLSEAKKYLKGLSISDKAAIYGLLAYQSGAQGANPQPAGETEMAAMLDAYLDGDPNKEFLLSAYDEYIDGATYEDNMNSFGKVSYDAPNSISIYTDSFENKEAIADCIENYNKTVEKDKKIVYTDYVAMLTSSITSIVDVISYVLIAFVAVSLFVSCIMIGIITHISVLERTKEIGILRAIGASKRNISQVFNAETVIIGLFSGGLGVFISWLLTFLINLIIQGALDSSEVSAQLPLLSALILVLISVVITVIGGLIPAKKAAKKDPVIALRSE